MSSGAEVEPGVSKMSVSSVSRRAKGHVVMQREFLSVVEFSREGSYHRQ
jgi:hypothetical protein